MRSSIAAIWETPYLFEYPAIRSLGGCLCSHRLASLNRVSPVSFFFLGSLSFRHMLSFLAETKRHSAKLGDWNRTLFGETLPVQFYPFYLMKGVGCQISLFTCTTMNNRNIFYDQQIFFFAVTASDVTNSGPFFSTNITNHFEPPTLLYFLGQPLKKVFGGTPIT